MTDLTPMPNAACASAAERSAAVWPLENAIVPVPESAATVTSIQPPRMSEPIGNAPSFERRTMVLWAPPSTANDHSPVHVLRRLVPDMFGMRLSSEAGNRDERGRARDGERHPHVGADRHLALRELRAHVARLDRHAPLVVEPREVVEVADQARVLRLTIGLRDRDAEDRRRAGTLERIPEQEIARRRGQEPDVEPVVGVEHRPG